jgi:hypothetical protein
MAPGQPHSGSRLFADGGFWGSEYQSTMELIDVQLTPAKHKLGQRPPSETAKARIRPIIESASSAAAEPEQLMVRQPTFAGLVTRRMLAQGRLWPSHAGKRCRGVH